MSAETSASQIAFNLLQKARNKFEAKKYDTALQYCQAALAIYEEIGDSVGVAYTLTNIGNIYRRQAVDSYEEALSTFTGNSIQISEEIAQSINSPLETQLDWYASNNWNTEILKPTDFGSYIGDGQPRFPVNAKGDGQPRSDRFVNKGARREVWSDDRTVKKGDGQPGGDGEPGGDGQSGSNDPRKKNGKGQQ